MSLKLSFIDKQLLIAPVPDMSPSAGAHCQAAEPRAGVTRVAWCLSSLPIGLKVESEFLVLCIAEDYYAVAHERSFAVN